MSESPRSAGSRRSIAYGPLSQHIQLVGLAPVLVPIACLLVMVRAPRERPREPRRLLWLVPVCRACGAPRPRPRQPAGGSRGRVRRRTARTPPRSTLSDRVQPRLDHPTVSPRGPTGPRRPGPARRQPPWPPDSCSPSPLDDCGSCTAALRLSQPNNGNLLSRSTKLRGSGAIRRGDRRRSSLEPRNAPDAR